MDELLMLLQAKLDEAKSKGNINSDIKKVQGQIDKLKVQAEIDPKAISNLVKQLEGIINQKINITNINVDVGNAQKVGQQVGQTIANATQKEIDKVTQKANKIQLSFDTGSYQSKVDSLVARTNQWVNANGEARISTESLQTALSNLGTAYNNLNSSGGNTVANQQALIEAEKALDAEVKRVQSSVTSMNATMAKSSAVDSLRQKIQQFYDINTASHGRWGNDLKNIMSQLANGAEVPIVKLKELERQFITIQNTARQTGKLGLSFFDGIKQGMSKFSYWTSSTFIIMKSVQEVKQMVTNVQELDDALTNISYTMDVSNKQLEKIGNSSLEMAKNLHSSAKDVLDAVKLYANAKESADSILTKAQTAIMMSNVTGFSGETSAKYLQTIMNQFDYTQDDLMKISDTIQSVSQNIAHDFADGIVQINDAISDSGEVARAAGMDLAEYSSIIGVLVENTGLQGSQLGNAMKSIITRTTKAGKILGIDEGDISNAEKALRDIGMEVRKSDGEFKEFDDTMAELASRWDELSQVEQSEISFQLAGTRQTSILKSLLKNWDEVVAITEKANNSSGVTLENQNTYAESLKGKLTELSAIWENIGDDTVSSSWLKGLTDVGIGVSSLIEKFGLLKTAIVGIGAYAGFKNVGINTLVAY